MAGLGRPDGRRGLGQVVNQTEMMPGIATGKNRFFYGDNLEDVLRQRVVDQVGISERHLAPAGVAEPLRVNHPVMAR